MCFELATQKWWCCCIFSDVILFKSSYLGKTNRYKPCYDLKWKLNNGTNTPVNMKQIPFCIVELWSIEFVISEVEEGGKRYTQSLWDSPLTCCTLAQKSSQLCNGRACKHVFGLKIKLIYCAKHFK